MDTRTFIFIAAFLSLLFAAPALSQGWTPSFSANPSTPALFMAVDMGRQRAFLVRNKDGELNKIKHMPCTTGMRGGGKLLEGDRKTPEGVYFLEGKATGGLDFDLFGNTAYPLNYPNPVDRIQGKTGNGIMIHGRGRSFGPRQTLGCVVLENDDVDTLDRHVRINATPIVIAESVSLTGKAGPPPEIVLGTWGWIKARERRENAFFEIYDPVRFEKSSNMSFARFRQKTLQEFASAEWVDIRIENLQVLQGPDYMVSVFAQRTFPHGEQGWRRLYWMRQVELWKIVGEEWIPQNLGGSVDYAQLVGKEIRERLRECAQAWDKGDLKTLLRTYDRTGSRNGAQGREAIAASLERDKAAKKKNPYSAEPKVRVTKQGVEANLLTDGHSRTILFLPGAFNTWLIARDEAAKQP
ncbi:MAG: L,D-transpeptidase family protein [Desulfomicrobium sp.]|nr:L,D-transpeptidase family protein [Pseudomonadota bacterium]MBV1712836.1 L,D-transpeptidase family protein [Desulfomicrobium sp.]MBU4571806.1 L,D-transpeptidase family protein [Pseudomonadota bacterium]MBU4595955.1 L,D-transpeptidase family protein [Pseudomonadota bacterium]MBV1721259.1 L,D-transpeptidase family protein [Desulfomicrobium sp.]